MPRSIRLAALSAAVAASIAVVPASASADLIPPTATPPSLNFGSLPVGTQSLPQPVSVTETCISFNCITALVPDGFSPVITATTGFTQSSDCPTNLLAFLGIPQTCVIDIGFVPNAIGPLTGLLSTGSGGPTVTLNGTGSAPHSSSGRKTRTRKCKKKKHHSLAASAAKKKCKKRR